MRQLFPFILLYVAAGFICGYFSFQPAFLGGTALVLIAATLWIVRRQLKRTNIAVPRVAPVTASRLSEAVATPAPLAVAQVASPAPVAPRPSDGKAEFFEFAEQFEHLKSVLPDMLQAKRHQSVPEIRVWCVSHAKAQDVYSLAMVLREAVPYGSPVLIKMLATDTSYEILEELSQGIFTRAEVQSIPAKARQNYLIPVKEGLARQYQVHPRLFEMIRFAPFDLQTEPYPFRFPFDIIFCRKTLGRYESAAAANIVEKLRKSLAPHGLLFVAPDEASLVNNEYLATVAPGVSKRLVKDLHQKRHRRVLSGEEPQASL